MRDVLSTGQGRPNQQKIMLPQHTVTKPIFTKALRKSKLKRQPHLQSMTVEECTDAQIKDFRFQIAASCQLHKWFTILTTRFAVTYPLLLLLGPILRSLGQRDNGDRVRIFKRPPLPWRESRGATGVKTPDNQSGILKFHKLKAKKVLKKNGTLLLGENESWSVILTSCKSTAPQLMLHHLCQPTDF